VKGIAGIGRTERVLEEAPAAGNGLREHGRREVPRGRGEAQEGCSAIQSADAQSSGRLEGREERKGSTRAAMQRTHFSKSREGRERAGSTETDSIAPLRRGCDSRLSGPATAAESPAGTAPRRFVLGGRAGGRALSAPPAGAPRRGALHQRLKRSVAVRITQGLCTGGEFRRRRDSADDALGPQRLIRPPPLSWEQPACTRKTVLRNTDTPGRKWTCAQRPRTNSPPMATVPLPLLSLPLVLKRRASPPEPTARIAGGEGRESRLAHGSRRRIQCRRRCR
jgi:hypothetical protein